jgi:hypothetical protein
MNTERQAMKDVLKILLEVARDPWFQGHLRGDCEALHIYLSREGTQPMAPDLKKDLEDVLRWIARAHERPMASRPATIPHVLMFVTTDNQFGDAFRKQCRRLAKCLVRKSWSCLTQTELNQL